ncbi:hypothetical protein OJ253_1673 [Cryptosporidium canis]|uniref:Uncharacterized protein n=1 Tax=Cryptosporidium canis TaxID=195482 RepID=A0A9D5HXI0_9CRYT|nr:hypothetical protein OJ253_1673 [Cryptosporidium canis]
MAPYWTRLMISIIMSLLDHSTSLQYLSDPSFEKKIEFTLPIRNTTNKYVEISDPKLALVNLLYKIEDMLQMAMNMFKNIKL